MARERRMALEQIFELLKGRKNFVFVGEAGSGKSELAINFAREMASRQEKSVLAVCLMALVLSCLFTWVPVLNTVSAGISIVICTVAAAAVCAWLFPVEDEEVAA